MDGNRVEDRFYIVVAVSSFLKDIEAKVYFTVGEDNHGIQDFLVLMILEEGKNRKLMQ